MQSIFFQRGEPEKSVENRRVMSQTRGDRTLALMSFIPGGEGFWEH